MSETIKDEMWRVAGNLIGGDNLGGSVIQLNYGTALGFLADKIEELRAQMAAQRRPLNPNRFDCPECGQGVAADEDGCCATCGHDCDAYEDGVRVVTAERDAAKPAPPVGQAGGLLWVCAECQAINPAGCGICPNCGAAKGASDSTGNELAMDRNCPSEHCWFCTGEACKLCGAGCWDNAPRPSPGRPICQHDVTDRHQEPEPANHESEGALSPGDKRHG